MVIAASYLHDIGIHQAERKYNSTAGDYQERKGPPIARDILERLGLDKKTIDEVCDLIAHHHSPGHIETLNLQILWEADTLVNLEGAPIESGIRSRRCSRAPSRLPRERG